MSQGKGSNYFYKKKLLDNFKIKNKFILIYVFCVILPVALTDWFMYKSLKNNVENQQKSQLYSTMERLHQDIMQEINDCISVSNYLYTDTKLNQFLNRSYLDHADYYGQYNSLMHNNVIRYYYTAQSVYGIRIYTENDTLTNGGNFMNAKTVVDQEWYKAFKASKKDIFIYSYYSFENKYIRQLGPARKISIIRYLNNFSKGNNSNILKIDLDYNRMVSHIKNEGVDRDVFVSDSRNIILSSKDTAGAFEEYLPSDSINLKDVTISNVLPVLADKWKLTITADKPDMVSKFKENKIMLIVIVIGNVILPSIVIIFISGSLSTRLKLTEAYIRKVENEEFERIECYEGMDEIGNLIRSYNLMVSKIKELIEVVFKKNSEKQALEISKRRAELNALQTQINPHFIFNTLESIRMRSLIKNELETAQIIEEFAKFMRRTMKWERDFIPIEEEMKYVENYLKIQKYRFGDKINFSLYINESCKNVKIPKFGIITFVENACVHGIENTSNDGVITVVISRGGNQIYVEIMDNGNGMNEQQLNKIREMIDNASIERLSNADNIGILNAYIRLKIYYNDNVSCTIESTEGEGTDVCLILPVNNEGDKGEGDADA